MSENEVKKETLGEMLERLSPKKPKNTFIKILIRKRIQKEVNYNIKSDRSYNNYSKESILSDYTEKINNSPTNAKKTLELRNGFQLRFFNPNQKNNSIERSFTARPHIRLIKRFDKSMLSYNNSNRKSSKFDKKDYEIINFLKNRQKYSPNDIRISGIKIMKNIC